MSRSKWLLVVIFPVLLILAGGGLYFLSNAPRTPSSSSSPPSSFYSTCDTFELVKDKRNPVPLELAKSVASAYVYKAYPGYNWVFVGQIPAYSAYFGYQSGHVFIFRKDLAPLSTLEELERHARGKPEANQAESSIKYLFNDIATIITGAMKEDELILRHFRGLPQFFVKKQENKEYVEGNFPGKTIGRLIMHTPLSFGYEILFKDSQKATGDIIFGERIDSSSSMTKTYQNNLKRKSEIHAEECKWYKDAIIEAKEANIREWDSYP